MISSAHTDDRCRYRGKLRPCCRGIHVYKHKTRGEKAMKLSSRGIDERSDTRNL